MMEDVFFRGAQWAPFRWGIQRKASGDFLVLEAMRLNVVGGIIKTNVVVQSSGASFGESETEDEQQCRKIVLTGHPKSILMGKTNMEDQPNGGTGRGPLKEILAERAFDPVWPSDQTFFVPVKPVLGRQPLSESWHHLAAFVDPVTDGWVRPVSKEEAALANAFKVRNVDRRRVGG